MKGLLTPDGSTILIIHRLKTWPDVYQEIEIGAKVHEFRKNDRDFKLGEVILLEEFIPAGERYTGRATPAQITSISYGPEWGIPEGWATFSIRPMDGTVVDIKPVDTPILDS